MEAMIQAARNATPCLAVTLSGSAGRISGSKMRERISRRINLRHRFETDEHAVFLSGNGPLVDVLQAALSKDRAERNHIPLKTAEREAKTFIQIIHKFRDDAMITASAPKEKVAILTKPNVRGMHPVYPIL